MSVKDFFGRNGFLASWHPNHEYRPGQLDMAEAVQDALADKQHLIVEAGTGTGKTLAYLIPAILSGRRVIVSTGTKNLQEQLYLKDIPFLQEHMPGVWRVAYMKGRSNFACRQKVLDAQKEAVLTGLEEVADFEIVRKWEAETEFGDRSEIKTLPEKSSAWTKIDARGELCTGQKCAQFERCFITKMQQRAHESEIVIVNHHLFFADLALREQGIQSILPDYDSVIFDEAHELEDVAGEYFGLRVSNYQVQELRRDISDIVRRKKVGSPEMDRALIGLEEKSETVFNLFGDREGRASFRSHKSFVEEHGEEYQSLLIAIEIVGTTMQGVTGQPEEFMPLLRRAGELMSALSLWMAGDQPGCVYWIERRGRGIFLAATPIDVSAVLREKLFNKVGAVIMTSATLTVAGSFDYAEQRLGVSRPRSLIAPSQFDFQKQALLYVPQELPDPRNAAFTRAAGDEIIRILKLSQGRAFCLFTSYSQMKLIYDRLSYELDFPTLLQGTGPRSALLDEFKRTKNCVLFATSSFWQGVDVQGEALSCVIIDKLPFAVPSDPIVEARVKAMRDAGGEPFSGYQIPQAAIALKQGFGRLIRARTDRGVLALLDNRITKQRYGQIFFDSLPDYAFTTQIKDVERFFDV